MSAWDYLPAHLTAGRLPAECKRISLAAQSAAIGPQPSGPVVYSEAGRWDGKPLTFGTPPSPPTPTPSPIVTIRPSGERGSELYVRTGDGAQLVVVPLSWGHLSNLAADAVAAMIRHGEGETP